MPKLYPKIPHLPQSRLGSSDRHCATALAERLLLESKPHDRVVVQEKLDGSNVVIVRQTSGLLALGRDGQPCFQSRNPNRQAFGRWLAANAKRFFWLGNLERLVCEWLPVAHGTRYALPHEPIVLLDLFRQQHRVTVHVLEPLANVSGLTMPHLLHRGTALPLESALQRLGTHGFHGATDPAEGVVYRLESQDQTLALAKFVRHTKQDGVFLADHTGLPDVQNTFLGSLS
jgi:hypothetical protein